MSLASELRVNGARLYQALATLGTFGSYRDARSGLMGVSRLALTDGDREGREHVVERMQALGLSVRVDRVGNVMGYRGARDDSAAPVLIGSHIDSVQTGGRFDGCLGVLAGLEVLETLNERGIETERPVGVGFFTEEEGARFGTDMLGSAVATGRISLEEAYALRDTEGLSLRRELKRIGFLGEAEPLLPAPHAFLELHIEQGPCLRAAGLEVGVVTGVQAISWQELTILGRTAHAGTTPMELRADAGLALARINLELRRMIASGDYGDMRANVGSIRLEPNLVNVVPGRCVASVDLRNRSDTNMAAAERDLLAFYSRVEAEEGVELSWRQTARTETVAFDTGLQARLAAAAEGLGLKQGSIVSGAGHDAQEFARIAPTGMIFVPGEHAGISHNPRELSTEAQCTGGANVLLAAVLDLAGAST